MPNVINCPLCQASLTLPEADAGKSIACPACAAVFRAPAPLADTALVSGPPAVPPPTTAAFAVAPRRLMPSAALPAVLDPAWAKVRNGLHLMLIGMLIASAALLLGGILVVLANVAGISNPTIIETILLIILLGASLGALAGGGTWLVGLIWGLATRDPKCKSWLVAVLVFLAFNVLVPIIAIALAMWPAGGQPPPRELAFTGNFVAWRPLAVFFLYLLTEWLVLVNVLVFIHYLSAIAEYFGNERLIRSFKHSLIFQYTWIALMISLTALSLSTMNLFGNFRNYDRELHVVLFGALAIGIDVFYGLWLVVLLRRTRNLVRDALAEGIG